VSFFSGSFFAPVKILCIIPYQEGNLRPMGSVEIRAQKKLYTVIKFKQEGDGKNYGKGFI